MNTPHGLSIIHSRRNRMVCILHLYDATEQTKKRRKKGKRRNGERKREGEEEGEEEEEGETRVNDKSR